MAEPASPPAFMLLRAWVESGSDSPLRVRIRTDNNPDSRDRYLADVNAVTDLVGDWLNALVEAAKPK